MLVRERLKHVRVIDYVGPRYGRDKDAFYDSIDVLVFPTQNEAEPLVVHEAIERGVPVIAYGSGAIPEIINSDCGRVVRAEGALLARGPGAG